MILMIVNKFDSQPNWFGKILHVFMGHEHLNMNHTEVDGIWPL